MDIQKLRAANKLFDEMQKLELKLNSIRNGHLTISIDGIYQNSEYLELYETLKTQTLIYLEQKLNVLYKQFENL